MLTLRRRYELEAAHRLTAGVPEGHKCRRPHGHRYVLTVFVAGELDDAGMLIEYEELDRVLRPILRMVDHNDLNTLPERCSTPYATVVAANPTVERLVQWFAMRLELVNSARPAQALHLVRLVLEEDSSSAVEWTR